MKRPRIDSTEDMITEAALAHSSAKLIAAGSVMCVMRSGILRHSFPVAVNDVDVAMNQDMRALSVVSGVSADFVAHYLRARAQHILDIAMKGGTTVNSVEAARLDELAVPVPPLETQRRIVDRIDELFTELDDADEALSRAKEDLGVWRKALLKAAVTGELTADWRAANTPSETGADLLSRILIDRRTRASANPNNKSKRYVEPLGPEISDLPALPEGWVWASLEHLIDRLRNGISVKPAHTPPGIPILRISAVRAMAVNASQRRWLPSTFVVGNLTAKTGDLLFTRYNGNPELVGVCGRYRSETNVAYPDKIMCATPAQIDPAIGDYLELATNAGAGRRYIQSFTKTSAGQHGVSGDTVKKAPIPLPPADEMGEIVARYAAARDQIENGWISTEPLIDDVVLLRQSILAAAFRGDLVQ